MAYSVAVDIGGTFTDIVLRAPDGGMIIDKTLTTPHDLIEGFMRGVSQVLAKAKLTPADIDGLVVHATTVDQVDATAFALAWIRENPRWTGGADER